MRWSPSQKWLRRSAYASLGFASLAAFQTVPLERIPNSVLPVRIFFDGVSRAMRSAWVGAQMTYQYKWVLRNVDDPEVWKETHFNCAKKLCSALEANGGLYVKIGQSVAAMNNLLPIEYTVTLSRLHDKVFSRSISEVYTVIIQDFGRPLNEVFSHIRPRPVAAASMAQVHEAELAGTGERVAVKVQYIDVAHRLASDMAVIRLWFKLSSLFFPGWDWSEMLKEANEIFESELRLEEEGHNGDRCRAELQAKFGDIVTTPKVYKEFTTKRVLTTEFIDGWKVTDRRAMEINGIDPMKVAKLYVSVFAHQLFHTGFLHADPHPGNVFVRIHPKSELAFTKEKSWHWNEKRKGQLDYRTYEEEWQRKLDTPFQLVVLDHGLYTTIPQHERLAFAGAWVSAVRKDMNRVQQCGKKLGVKGNFDLFASLILEYPYNEFSLFGGVQFAALLYWQNFSLASLFTSSNGDHSSKQRQTSASPASPGTTPDTQTIAGPSGHHQNMPWSAPLLTPERKQPSPSTSTTSSTLISKETEKERVGSLFYEEMDNINAICNDLSIPMNFALTSIDIVRSVNQELGGLVNRSAVMYQSALEELRAAPAATRKELGFDSPPSRIELATLRWKMEAEEFFYRLLRKFSHNRFGEELSLLRA